MVKFMLCGETNWLSLTEGKLKLQVLIVPIIISAKVKLISDEKDIPKLMSSLYCF